MTSTKSVAVYNCNPEDVIGDDELCKGCDQIFCECDVSEYSEHPCGADGLSFPNGLPHPGDEVEVKTVWNPNWHVVKFRGRVSSLWPEKGHYDWFGIYAKPRVSEGEHPIVLEWREPQ